MLFIENLEEKEVTVKMKGWVKMKELEENYTSYYLDFVRKAETRLTGKEQNRAAGEIQRDYANIINALGMLVGAGQLEKACQMATALSQFWYTSPSYRLEGCRWLTGLIEKVRVSEANSSPSVNSKGNSSGSEGAWELVGSSRLGSTSMLRVVTGYPIIGEFTKARLYHQAARLLTDRTTGELELNQAENLLLESERLLTNLKRIANSGEVAIELEQELGRVYNNLGNIAYYRGDYERATSRYSESLELARVVGDNYGSLGTLTNLAHTRLLAEHFGEARELYLKLAELNRELGDTLGEASAVKCAGLASLKDLDFREALGLLAEGLAICNRVSRTNIHVVNSGFTLDILLHQGLAHQLRYQSFEALPEDFLLAAGYYHKGLTLTREISVTSYVSFYALYSLRLVISYLNQNEGRNIGTAGLVTTMLAGVFCELEMLVRLKPEILTTSFDNRDRKLYAEVRQVCESSLILTGDVVTAVGTSEQRLDPLVNQEFILADKTARLLGMFLGNEPDQTA